MLVNEGVPLGEISFMELTWDINDLIDGKVDATSAYSTDAPHILDERGISYTIMRPVNYGIDFYGDCIFTSEIEIKEHPERVKAFREASLRGWEYAMDNKEELVAIILYKYKSRLSREELLYEAGEMENLMLHKFIEIGHINPGRWTHIADTYVTLGMLGPDYSLEGFIYEPEPEFWFHKFAGILWRGLLAVAAIAAILIFLNIYLRKIVRNRTAELSQTNKKLVAEISERNKVEDALRKSEEQYQSLVGNIPDVVWRSDSDGKYVFISHNVQKISGYSREEIYSQGTEPWFDRVHQNDISNVRKSYKDLFETGRALDIEYRFRRKDGKWIWLHDRSIGTHQKDSMIYADGVFSDITEYKTAQEMMIQSEKMMSIGGLAAGIAHEINNPLAGIIQYVQVIRQRFSGGLKKNKDIAAECGTVMESITAYAERRGLFKMMESIAESEQRAARIVQSILNFSRKNEITFASYDLRDLLDDTVFLAGNDYDLKKKYDFKNIKITREYDDDVPKVECDATKIQQVFFNIIKNGVQAMVPPRSGVAIKQSAGSSCFILRVKNTKHRYLQVEIEDNGPGIDEDTREHIFEPFFTTKASAGTGLGLSISYFIIKENHKGSLAVKSIPGEGTSFIIRLPVERIST